MVTGSIYLALGTETLSAIQANFSLERGLKGNIVYLLPLAIQVLDHIPQNSIMVQGRFYAD